MSFFKNLFKEVRADNPGNESANIPSNPKEARLYIVVHTTNHISLPGRPQGCHHPLSRTLKPGVDTRTYHAEADGGQCSIARDRRPSNRPRKAEQA